MNQNYIVSEIHIILWIDPNLRTIKFALLFSLLSSYDICNEFPSRAQQFEAKLVLALDILYPDGKGEKWAEKYIGKWQRKRQRKENK